jgi:Ca-activated chloride channel family protein
MRTLLAVCLFILGAHVAGISAAPEDRAGPRLEEQIRKQPAQAQRTDIRVNVNLTLVPVTVLDTQGRNVTGLRAENFRVYDGSDPVRIVAFSQEDQPISVGLVFDCSRSMRLKFKTARHAPAELYNQLNERDESFLITVSDRPLLRQGYTSDFSNIENALLFTNPAGTTSLLDAVYMGLAQLRKAHNPRKALVVVSDGGDNNSRYSLRELEELAVESDVQIYAIGLYQNPQSQEEEDGPMLLGRLAVKTGGVSYSIAGPSQLRYAMTRIGTTLHSQYVLGYYPPANEARGKYRSIRVQLRVPPGLPKLTLYARSTYYVPER